MLTLRNIKSSDGIIYADYEPENSNTTGKIVIRISDKEVICSATSEYDKDFPIYLNHAIKALKKMASEYYITVKSNVIMGGKVMNVTPFPMKGGGK